MTKSYTKGTVKLVTVSNPQKGMSIVYSNEVLDLTHVKEEPCDFKYWVGVNSASVVWTNDIHELKELVIEYEGKERGLPKKKGDRFFSSRFAQETLIWDGRLSELGVGHEGGSWTNPAYVFIPKVKQVPIKVENWKDLIKNNLVDKEVKFRFELFTDLTNKPPCIISMAKVYISPTKPDWIDLYNQYQEEVKVNKYSWSYNDWLAENFNPPIKLEVDVKS